MGPRPAVGAWWRLTPEPLSPQRCDLAFCPAQCRRRHWWGGRHRWAHPLEPWLSPHLSGLVRPGFPLTTWEEDNQRGAQYWRSLYALLGGSTEFLLARDQQGVLARRRPRI